MPVWNVGRSCAGRSAVKVTNTGMTQIRAVMLRYSMCRSDVAMKSGTMPAGAGRGGVEVLLERYADFGITARSRLIHGQTQKWLFATYDTWGWALFARDFHFNEATGR